jgi:O-antigen/teichoic acid export membrane protein
LMALQSYLITIFARPQRSPWPLLLALLAGCLAVASILAVVAAVIGPPILREVFGPEFVVRGRSLALLVLSSGGLGALCMSSPALVARNRHAANTVGWWIAVLVAVAVLAFAPWSLQMRAPVALLAGPCLGLMWHLAALARFSAARAS